MVWYRREELNFIREYFVNSCTGILLHTSALYIYSYTLNVFRIPYNGHSNGSSASKKLTWLDKLLSFMHEKLRQTSEFIILRLWRENRVALLIIKCTCKLEVPGINKAERWFKRYAATSMISHNILSLNATRLYGENDPRISVIIWWCRSNSALFHPLQDHT